MQLLNLLFSLIAFYRPRPVHRRPLNLTKELFTTMQSNLDAAITDASTKEATYVASTGNVQTIQTAIEQATSPLAPAIEQQKTDAAAFNQSLQTLSDAALASRV